MFDILLTAIIPAFLLIVILCSIKFKKQPQTEEAEKVELNGHNDFMNLSYTNALKGAACIIVVMVHIPIMYGNKLQDIISSFGYISVTIFFLISGYGCSYGVNTKGRPYLNLFWPKRIIALFIPALLINILHFVLEWVLAKHFDALTLVIIDNYILAILVEYFIFWLIWSLHFIPSKFKDFIIIALVIIVSVVSKCTKIGIIPGWETESLGFIWGILLYRFKKNIVDLILKNQLIIIFCSFILSIAFGFCYLKFKSIYFAGDYLLKILLGLIIILFIFSISIRLSFLGKPIQFLGHISYSVYLSHGIVMNYFAMLIGDINSGWFILIVYVLTIILSTLIFALSKIIIHFLERQLLKLVERIKSNRDINKIDSSNSL